MPVRLPFLTRAFALGFALLCAGRSMGADNAGVTFFENRIRPLLIEHCYECHSAEAKKSKGGLLLDSMVGWEKGGDSGPVIVPGEPEKSLLIKAVRYLDKDLQMPPKNKQLTATQISDLVQWVKLGAPDPRTQAAVAIVPDAKPAIDFAAAKKFWAFQPVKEQATPLVKNKRWARTAIDHFILAKLESSGMKPGTDADKRTLIRRATFDLTGLPPSPEEIAAFLADKSPNAFDKVVDRLLASPAYGERWGRHWLDLVRYADTSGCNADVPIPDAYKYRDYVISSFNHDKPYDRFIREQIAGDLLPSMSEAEHYEKVIATGYLAISRRFSSLGEEPHLTFDDTIDNVGKTMLGLTLSCARCHDHKYDPLPTDDYYALYGIFSSTRYSFPGTEIPRHARNLIALAPRERYEKEIKPYEDQLTALDKEMDAHYARKVSLDTGKERNAADAAWKKTTEKRDELIKAAPKYEHAYAVTEGEPANAPILIKGDPKKVGKIVDRGFLQVLGGQKLPPAEKGSGRRELADWLSNANNPLTARVMVNRIWLNHFGEGLVRSPNDFGARGQAPTHPELLDYLASRFIASGWSIKAMHKEMMLSRVYQLATTENPAYAQKDPDNRLLWKFNRRRLSAEEIRDGMLAVSGGLDRSPGGAHPFKPEWEWRYTQHNPYVGDYTNNHRSVYLMNQRIRMQPILGVFDGADANMAIGQRPLSTTAIQALFMMNDAFAHQQAEKFAQRVLACSEDNAKRVQLAYQLAFARPATKDELRHGAVYLEAMQSKFAAAKTPAEKLQSAVWASYCRVLYSSNEFIFLE